MPTNAADDGGVERNEQPHVAVRTTDDWQRLLRSLNLRSDAAVDLVPELIGLLTDQSLPAELRQQVAFTLGRMQSRGGAAIPHFVQLLDETNVATGGANVTESPRLWSLKGLAYMGASGRSAVPAIVPIALNRGLPKRERLAAMETLSQIGTSSSSALETLWRLTRPVSRSNASIPTNPDHGLESTTTDEQGDEEIRLAAVESLAYFNAAASPAIPDLIDCTRSESEPLRRASAVTLGRIGSDVAIDALVDLLLFDPSPAVRDEAAISLARLGRPAVPVLQQLLDDREQEVRWRAADALGRIGPAALPALTALQTLMQQGVGVPSTAEVQLAAIEAVWRITRRSDEVVPALGELLGVSDRSHRMRAYRLLLKIAADPDHREPVLLLLRSLTSSPNPYSRQSATQALRLLEPQ